MDVEKLIEQLNNLEACAYGYHINGEVLGMDCSDFEQLMVDAAEEISKISTLQAENEKLRDELEQVKQERYVAVECINTVYSYILIKSKTDAVRTIEKWLRGQKED